MSTTLKTIVEREALILAGTNTPVNISVTSGDTTSIISTSASPNKTAATAYNGVEAVVTQDAGGSNAAPENESRIITLFNGTNDWTVTQAYTAALASGDKVSFLYRMGYTSLLDSINTIVRNLPLPRWLPLSLDPDGDMESSSAWGSNVGGGGGAKETTAADTLLRRSQRVTGSSDGDGQRGSAFYVSEGEILFVDVALNCTTGTAEVELYDSTGSAVISGTSYTADDRGHQRISFQYVVGADIEQIAVQVTQDGATALDCNVSWVSVLSSRSRVYDLPFKPFLIEGIELLPENSTYENDSEYVWERKVQAWPVDGFIRDQFGANPNRIKIAIPRYEGALFLKCRQTDTVLDSMEDTLYIDGDELEAFLGGVDAEVYKRLADQASSQGNVQLEISYKLKAKEKGAAYSNLLASMSLAQPIIRSGTQRRVAV